MKIIPSFRFILGGSLASLLAMHSVQAVDLTWNNGAATGNWNTTDANFTGVAWSAGNTAVFGGTANSTIDINAGAVSATGVTFNVGGDIINASSGSITLTGTPVINTGLGLTSTINANINSAVGLAVETTAGTGTGTLNLGGLTTLSSAGDLVIGGTASSTAKNTLNLASGGRLLFTVNNWVRLGGSAGSGSNGNKLNVSTPGSNASRSMQIGNLDIGNTTSGNEMKVSNGAYVVREATLSGQATWNLGLGVGGDTNRLIVTGAGTVATMKGTNALRQFLKVGVAGSGNYVQVDSGGSFSAFRAELGSDGNAGGGDNNYIHVKDAGSTLTITDSQMIFTIGNSAGSTGNYLKVSNGATGTITNSGDAKRAMLIGGGISGNGSDSNYVEVTGAGSTLALSNFQVPITIGGQVISSATSGGTITVTDNNTGGNTATGNHLDIGSGGAVTFTSTSLYVMGVSSEVNLGDGTGTSTLTTGASAGVGMVAGVYLKNSDGRLNFDGGKLIAGADGNLVSGAGKIDLLGDATVSTTQTLSTISVVIEDSTSSGGSFTKEGTGTLDLTQINTYTGDTIVAASGGILKMENAYLANGAAVRLFSGGQLDLNTGGATDTIAALYFDGVLQAGGTWGGTGSGATNINTTFFAPNSGKLFVAVIPEPAAALLGGLGMLTLLRRRRLA